MDKINIKIEGKAGTGTSVINKIITDALLKHGIGVANFTDKSKKFESKTPYEFGNTLKAMVERKTTCYLEKIQLPRE